ncbi:hypothetical protein ACQ4M4_25695 [Leptolyngbya sp. AN02str]|uniref:hypothetical protein n=1 Tax=Leptolyngbya sp. AN02str TaxID=3423363 RepID=UPI003D31F43D
MIDLQSVLGTEQATTFVESLQTVIHQLEVRQQHLVEELRDTSATLNAVKQIMAGSLTEATDAIEIATIVSLEDTEASHLQGPEGSNEEEEEEEEVAPSTKSRRSSTKSSTKTKATKTKRRKSSAKLGRRPKLSPKASKAETPTGEDLAESSTHTEISSSDAIAAASNFNPRESVLKEFQDQTLRTSIKTILERNAGQPMSTDDVLQALYGKRISQENLQMARRVIVVELSKGKLAGIWANVDGRRGHYIMPLDEDQA